jgi:hypothetical protein
MLWLGVILFSLFAALAAGPVEAMSALTNTVVSGL